MKFSHEIRLMELSKY